MVVHLCASTLVVGGILASYRWIDRRAPRLAQMFALGLIIRSLVGTALFFISWFQLPVLTQLQLGQGFWALAIDARTYYNIAANAVANGLGTISSTDASPLFLRVLAGWMWFVGVSPASAVLLNIVSYAVGAVAIVSTQGSPQGGERLNGAMLVLAATTFSPALIIFGTQPLKDQVCTTAIILGGVGGRLWWTSLRGCRWQSVSIPAAVAMLSAGIYVVAGIRAYAALLMLGALSAGAIYCVARTRSAGLRIASAHVALLTVLWIVFIAGAGAYYEPYHDAIIATVHLPTAPAAMLDRARDGFVRTGGATSVASMPEESTSVSAPVGHPLGVTGRLRQLALGYAVMFVPITALQRVGLVRFGGGRGLLIVTDLDTVVIDVTVLASLWMVFIAVRQRTVLPELVFTLILALVTISAMAYVVTNYGTLFRLRLLGTTPLWMLPLMVDGRLRSPGKVV